MRICGTSICASLSAFCFTKESISPKKLLKESCYRAITGSFAAIGGYMLSMRSLFYGCTILKQKAIEVVLSPQTQCGQVVEKCFTACKAGMFGASASPVIKASDSIFFCGRAGMVIDYFNITYDQLVPRTMCYEPSACLQSCGKALQSVTLSDITSISGRLQMAGLTYGVTVASLVDVVINQLDLKKIGVESWGAKETLKWGCGIAVCMIISSATLYESALAYGAYRATYGAVKTAHLAAKKLAQCCSSFEEGLERGRMRVGRAGKPPTRPKIKKYYQPVLR